MQVSTCSGLAVAAKVLGCRQQELLTEKGQNIGTYLCDKPDTWPEALQPKPQRLSNLRAPSEVTHQEMWSIST